MLDDVGLRVRRDDSVTEGEPVDVFEGATDSVVVRLTRDVRVEVDEPVLVWVVRAVLVTGGLDVPDFVGCVERVEVFVDVIDSVKNMVFVGNWL